MNLKKKVCAFALAGAVAVSALSLGFAAWHTDITAGGSASAQGSWAVSLTDASLTTSETGAQIAQDYSNYHLQANELTATQVGNLCIGAAAPKGTSGTLGTQSSTVGLNRNSNCHLCLVDTTRIDITRFGHIPTNGDDGRAAMYRNYVDGTDSDAPIIRLRDTNVTPDGTELSPVKAWIYYRSNDTHGDSAVQQKIAAEVVQSAEELLRQLRPDTYQNYALVSFSTNSTSDATKDQSDVQFVIASMGADDGSAASSPVTVTDTGATFANVDFSLPGAWANYTLTVTNNGTANANLADVQIALNSESDQLELVKPELADETLAPGESCTFNVVVKAADIESGDLNATGALSITLPYSQDTVETAPDAGHTHG